MTSFDEREQGFERKYSHDQEFAFRVKARRNKMVGLWAASHLGLEGADAQRYADSIVAAELQKGGDEEVLSRLTVDLRPKGIERHQVEAEIERATAEAKEQLGAPK
jgi:hypothetical protein